MRVDISQEATAFAAAVLCGLFCGLLRDILKVFSKHTKNRILNAIFDFLLAGICAFAVIAVFYVYNSFQMRWYMFLGVFLGIILYFLMFSKTVSAFLEKILKLFVNIFKILLTPTRFLYKILLVYFFMPVIEFFKKLSGIFKAKIKKVFVNSRSKRNGKRKNKKTKKIKFHNWHFGRFGAFYACKGNSASTENNRKSGQNCRT